MNEMTESEHDSLIVAQLKERAGHLNKQASLRAELSRIGVNLSSLGECLKRETLPLARIDELLESVKAWVDCGKLAEELRLYEDRSKRLRELEAALKPFGI